MKNLQLFAVLLTLSLASCIDVNINDKAADIGEVNTFQPDPSGGPAKDIDVTTEDKVKSTSVTPPAQSTEKTTVIPTDKPTEKPSTAKPPTPEPSPSSSSSPITAKPAPVPSTPSPQAKGRTFDGPSFIGGIILASGLTAIGFVAFKFYKARTERNYHTL